jgi:hypothetical protein
MQSKEAVALRASGGTFIMRSLMMSPTRGAVHS